jgi:hypothetical protein
MCKCRYSHTYYFSLLHVESVLFICFFNRKSSVLNFYFDNFKDNIMYGHVYHYDASPELGNAWTHVFCMKTVAYMTYVAVASFPVNFLHWRFPLGLDGSRTLFCILFGICIELNRFISETYSCTNTCMFQFGKISYDQIDKIHVSYDQPDRTGMYICTCTNISIFGLMLLFLLHVFINNPKIPLYAFPSLSCGLIQIVLSCLFGNNAVEPYYNAHQFSAKSVICMSTPCNSYKYRVHTKVHHCTMAKFLNLRSQKFL